MKKHLSRLLTLLLVPLMLCQIASCGAEETDEDTTQDENEAVAVWEPDRPGKGLGRDVPVAAEENGIIICIDPGHGFMDGGTGDGILPDGLLEKDINMSIAKKLSEDLEFLGYTTILTHDGVNPPQAAIYDSIFNANERAAYANSITMDYFISIHVNSAANTAAEGSRIYYYDNSIKVKKIGGAISELMGQAIEEILPDDIDPMVIDQSPDPNTSFALCREVKYPSSLVEIGFCTNPNDMEKMIRDDWQELFAQGLANGIDAYFTEYAD